MYESTHDTWINLARSGDHPVWVRVSQIEAVMRRGGDAVVKMLSGTEHKSPLTVRAILNAITGKES